MRWQIEQEKVLKQYDKRVLFGAGNMCRNYMKCYGEEFPPLFTCDNNSKLWGTRLEGIEVKSPEELRNIPQDCAIFICNVYYKEIEEQAQKRLLEMLPEDIAEEYKPILCGDDSEAELWKYIKAADKISALIKCTEELIMGNREFSKAQQSTLKAIEEIDLPEVKVFMEELFPAYELTLDEQE